MADAVMEDLHQEDIQVDALPYVDPPMTKKLREQVNQMIEDEMQAFQPPDYLAALAVPQAPYVSALLAAEMERVAQGRASEPLDMSRFEIVPPSEQDEGDMGKWTKCIQNAQAQYMHQVVRETNLDLLTTCGKDAWLASNKNLEAQCGQYDQELAATQAKIEDVNQFRKHSQKRGATEMLQADAEWKELCKKNLAIQLEIEKMEREVKKRRVMDV
eukprot:TRINITY_DN9766_c0_g1_i1.p1 TRINITY_DN9766_c0_g1~~TRINITY_DN9766_c0_g1_i1.p1  ORF type:complete len:237 (+),score=90.82 TRINITY_DN9766_c0_g1_i1:68-712(+)